MGEVYKPETIKVSLDGRQVEATRNGARSIRDTGYDVDGKNPTRRSYEHVVLDFIVGRPEPGFRITQKKEDSIPRVFHHKDRVNKHASLFLQSAGNDTTIESAAPGATLIVDSSIKTIQAVAVTHNDAEVQIHVGDEPLLVRQNETVIFVRNGAFSVGKDKQGKDYVRVEEDGEAHGKTTRIDVLVGTGDIVEANKDQIIDIKPVWNPGEPLTKGLEGMYPDLRISEINRRAQIEAERIGKIVTVPAEFESPDQVEDVHVISSPVVTTAVAQRLDLDGARARFARLVRAAAPKPIAAVATMRVPREEVSEPAGIVIAPSSNPRELFLGAEPEKPGRPARPSERLLLTPYKYGGTEFEIIQREKHEGPVTVTQVDNRLVIDGDNIQTVRLGKKDTEAENKLTFVVSSARTILLKEGHTVHVTGIVGEVRGDNGTVVIEKDGIVVGKIPEGLIVTVADGAMSAATLADELVRRARLTAKLVEETSVDTVAGVDLAAIIARVQADLGLPDGTSISEGAKSHNGVVRVDAGGDPALADLVASLYGGADEIDGSGGNKTVVSTHGTVRTDGASDEVAAVVATINAEPRVVFQAGSPVAANGSSTVSTAVRTSSFATSAPGWPAVSTE